MRLYLITVGELEISHILLLPQVTDHAVGAVLQPDFACIEADFRAGRSAVEQSQRQPTILQPFAPDLQVTGLLNPRCLLAK